MKPQPHKALLAIITILVLLLAACQDSPVLPSATAGVTPAGGTPQPVEAATPESPVVNPTALSPTQPATDGAFGVHFSALKGQTIAFWHPWQGDTEKRAQAAVDDFNRSNPWGITVKIKALYTSGALYDAINTAVKQKDGEMPAVIAATTDQLAGWAQAGSEPGLVDLAPYVADGAVGLSENEVSAYVPAFWAQDTAGPVRFGIPALRTAQVLFYNQSWAQELGFSAAPKNPQEFKAQACAAAQHNNTAGNPDLYGTGGWIIDTDALTTLSWLAAFGAEPIPQAEGQPYAFESKPAESALAYLRGLLDDGCGWLAKNPAPYEYFASRMALFYSGTLADLYPQSRAMELAKSGDTWEILPFHGTDGKPFVYSSGYSYGVLKSTPEKQLAAWLFARWMETPSTAAALGDPLPSLPVSSAVRAQMASVQAKFPWAQVLPLADFARPAPGLASWRGARRMVEDAAWQIYHQTAESVPMILPALDEALR